MGNVATADFRNSKDITTNYELRFKSDSIINNEANENLRNGFGVVWNTEEWPYRQSWSNYGTYEAKYWIYYDEYETSQHGIAWANSLERYHVYPEKSREITVPQSKVRQVNLIGYKVVKEYYLIA